MNTLSPEVSEISPEKIPNGVHQCHALALNSGFLSREKFLEFFEKSEEIAENLLETSGFLNPETYENISEEDRIQLLENFFILSKQIKSEISEKCETPPAPHGGGTILEYTILSKLRGDASSNILMHEPRIGMFLYAGEEILEQSNTDDFKNYRGIFAFQELEQIKKYSAEMHEKLNISLKFGIELEDFENFPDGEKFRKKNRNQYEKFDYQIHSKHSMSVGEKNIPIDAEIDDFDKVAEQFSGNEIGMICQYVRDQIVFVRENGVSGDSLAHSDLIRLPLIKKLMKEKGVSAKAANAEISVLFQHQAVQNLYKKLLHALKEKEMSIGINLALGGKLHTKGIFYGQEILDLIAESGAPITIEKDTHNLNEEKLALEYWAAISEKIKNSGVKILE